MAKVRIKDEWKLWVALAVLGLIGALYLYWVSRPPMEGDEYLWQVTKITDNGDLSLKGSGKTIEFKLIALKVPKSEKAALTDFLNQELVGQWVRIKPVKTEPSGVQEGFVYLSGEDIHAKIIRLGMARPDREQKTVDVGAYIELEMEAKKAKRGFWSKKGQGDR